MDADPNGTAAERRETTELDRGDRPTRFAGAAAHGATWGVAFLTLRIFAVSGYDWPTAFLVSTTLGLDDGFALIFGSLIAEHTLTAVLLIGVLPLLIAGYLWGPREHRTVVLVLSALGVVVSVALTSSFGSWWLPAGAAAVFAVIAVIRRLPPQRPLRHALAVAMARVGWVAGVGVLILAALGQTPWVPHEVIETTGGTISGYVLSTEPGFLNVLTDEREFAIVISGNVLSRK